MATPGYAIGGMSNTLACCSGPHSQSTLGPPRLCICCIDLYGIKGAVAPRRPGAALPAHGRDPRAPALARLRAPPPLPVQAAPGRGWEGAADRPEVNSLRAANPSLEHPPDSGPHQERYASLRDGLRPLLTRPLRQALVLRYGFGGSP